MKPTMPAARDVLIVDDDCFLGRALARVVRGHHTVRVAESAAEALRQIEERAPDVVLCDFALGNETATAFLRTVRRRWPAIRLVLHSASRVELWYELLRDRIVDQYVVKPAAVADLLGSLGG